MSEIRYIEAGQLFDGTDPTYGTAQYVTVFACNRCSSLVAQWGQHDHTVWHRRVEG